MLFLFTLLPLIVFSLSPHSLLTCLQSQTSSITPALPSNINEELIKACRYFNHELIRHLLSQKADVNYVAKDGSTPLYWAHDQP